MFPMSLDHRVKLNALSSGPQLTKVYDAYHLNIKLLMSPVPGCDATFIS